jgi:hypothetical protein
MPLLSRSAFRTLLRRLSREAFERFVADLYRARGWAVDDGTEGIVVVTRPETGARRRLFVRHDAPRFARPSSPPGDVDAVVRSGTGPVTGGVGDADVVDADDLYGMAFYAIDRDTCATLFDTYFDRPPTEPDGASDAAAASTTEGVLPRRRLPRGYLVVALAVVLVLAAIGASAGVTTPGRTGVVGTDDAAGTEVEATPTADDRFVKRDRGPADPTPTASRRSVDAPFPPGLSTEGVTNVTALADAHTEALSGASYRLILVHRESVDGDPTGYRQERVDVASPTRYRSEIFGAGEVRTDSLVVRDAERYANGSVQFSRRETADGVEFEAHPLGPRVGRDPFLRRSKSYVRWFLSVEESHVSDVVERDGRTYFWLTFAGDPWPGVENTTGYALVSSTGVVHVIHRQYTPTSNRSVTVDVTVRVTGLGDAHVSPPAWYGAAQRDTGGEFLTAARFPRERAGTGDE